VVNRLTEKTAHGLVHFLRHIKGCYFERIHLDFELNSEEDGKMSPEVLKVLSTVLTRKKFMIYSQKTHCMDVMKLRVARQLVHCREFNVIFWEMENMGPVFDFLATARPVIQVATIKLRDRRTGAAFVELFLNVGCWLLIGWLLHHSSRSLYFSSSSRQFVPCVKPCPR